MRKSVWIILAVLGVAISTPKAHADTLYTPIFTCIADPRITCSSLPTAPAVSFPSLTTITITETWNGFVFLIPFPAPFSPADLFAWDNRWVINSPSLPLAQARISDLTLGGQVGATLFPVPSPGPSNVFDSGSLTFAPVATPEPSSLALMLTGVGLVLVMRKRIAQGLHQATGTPWQTLP